MDPQAARAGTAAYGEEQIVLAAICRMRCKARARSIDFGKSIKGSNAAARRQARSGASGW